MHISRVKKTENIAEYILYMYHVEDTIRKFMFNIPLLIDQYVRKQLPDASFLGQYENWYSSIAHEMQQTGKEKKGHICEVEEVITELIYLHNTLLTVVKDPKYIGLVEASLLYLDEQPNRLISSYETPSINRLIEFELNQKLLLSLG